MSGKEVSASDAGRPLKRSREEEEISNQAEEVEGLVALVKKRRADVKHIESRISALEAELGGAQTKLEAAESLLQAMQAVKNEGLDSGIRHQNGHDDGRSNGLNPDGNAEVGTPPSVPRPGSTPASLHNSSGEKTPTAQQRVHHVIGSARDVSGVNGSHPKSKLDNSGGRASSETDRRDRRSDVHESPARPRPDHRGGGRTPSELDRRDKKAQARTGGGETSQRVYKPSNLPPKQEHVDLIMSIKSNRAARPVTLFTPVFTSSQHKRKLRSLVLNPSSDNQCATSALDGVINFWQIHGKGLDINFRYSVDCLSPGQRHWPEDLVWHPDGHSLFAVYSADKQDKQVSIIKNDNKQKNAKFLEYKPHTKGILNGITFMPWSSSLFVTGGSDHMVHLWREQSEDVWKPKLLHGHIHTSAVLGVAGTHHKQMVLSAGADKRVIGFDPDLGRQAFKHDLDSKAMTVTPNTADFNLFMVQTGQPNNQLHLFDIRSRTELHTFGWHQETSETQSALISQSWSPDGYYTASGTADPKIVIFDIRFNGREPAQTIYAHTKRVFQATWHQTLPLLLSISSDYNIGVHRISGK